MSLQKRKEKVQEQSSNTWDGSEELTVGPGQPLVSSDEKTVGFATAVHDEEEEEEEEDTSLSPGTSVGRYVLLEKIGAGGMGVVYSAYDPRLDRKVALKFVRSNAAMVGGENESSAGARLLREAQAMARVTHPNVVTVFDAGVFEESIFIAMEFLSGTTLKQWLETKSPSFYTILDVVIRAGRGLVAAHERNLVHRDFKPDNVLVTDEGRVAVMDFGLVHYKDSSPQETVSREKKSVAMTPLNDRETMADPARFTTMGDVMGTFSYMPPEQLRGDLIDVRCDQFAFCVTLYESLYGVRPFWAKDIETRLIAIARGELREPKRRFGPRRLMNVIRRGLMARPEDRYPSMIELLTELERIRSPKRNKFIAVASVGAVLAIGANFIVNGSSNLERQCNAGEKVWANVWSSKIHQQVIASFQQSNLPFAEESAQKVGEVLDDYGEKWRTMHRTSCEDTMIREVQSLRLMDLRNACLGRRLSQARALIGRFVKSDEDTVHQALSAVYRISKIDECGDTKRLLTGVPPPKNDEEAERVEQLRTELDEVNALSHTGHYKQADKALDDLIDRTEQMGYFPVFAEALTAKASIKNELGEFDRARNTAIRAMFAAESGQDTRTALKASLRLVFINFARGNHEEADLWSDHARALLLAEDAEPILQALAKVNFGTAAEGRGNQDTAVREFNEAIDILERTSSEPNVTLIGAYNNLGISLESQGRWRESIAAAEKALSMRIDLFGALHPHSGYSYINLASTYMSLGEPVIGLEYAELANSIWRAVDPKHYFVYVNYMTLAQIAKQMGRIAVAEDYAEKSVAAIRESSPDDYNLASALTGLADIYLDAGKIDESEKRFEEAKSIRIRANPDRSVDIYLRHAITRIDEEKGNLIDAYAKRKELYREAISKWGEDSPRLGRMLFSLGATAYRLESFEEAIQYFEKGFELVNPQGEYGYLIDPLLIQARAQFALGDSKSALRSRMRARSLISHDQASPEQLANLYFTEAQLEWDTNRNMALKLIAEAELAFSRSDRPQSWIETDFRRWCGSPFRIP